jgi:hypothetical protein
LDDDRRIAADYDATDIDCYRSPALGKSRGS